MKKSVRARRAPVLIASAVASVLVGLLAVSGTAYGQTGGSSSTANAGGTPLIDLIETVSKSTGKNFIVDPRVTGNAVLVGIDPAKITYPQLLTVLQVHNFAAIEIGGITRIVPDTVSRQSATPLITGADKRADAEYVTRVLKVKSVPAAQLVPILRSLLPQNAHLAAFNCTNELLVVDTYANIRRIESVVASMDKGEPLTLEKCAVRQPGVVQSAPPASPAPQAPK
jgi:general secretion pathway protein D